MAHHSIPWPLLLRGTFHAAPAAARSCETCCARDENTHHSTRTQTQRGREHGSSVIIWALKGETTKAYASTIRLDRTQSNSVTRTEQDESISW